MSEDRTQKVFGNAAKGALIGLGIGALTGNAGRGAGIGALTGAATGLFGGDKVEELAGGTEAGGAEATVAETAAVPLKAGATDAPPLKAGRRRYRRSKCFRGGSRRKSRRKTRSRRY